MEENIILEQQFAEKQYLEDVIVNLEKVEDINFPAKVPPTGYTFEEEILDVTTQEIEVNFQDKDLISNNYKLSLIKEYELDVDENMLEGYLLVPVELNGINNFYLKDLSVPVSLNLNLFGTNTLELTSWGFKASDYFQKDGDTKTNVTIRYNLNNYFSDEINWTNLKLYTKDLTNTNNSNDFIEQKTLTSLGGQEELELTAQHVYSVQFTYDVVDEENILETKEIKDLWILGTPLFNDCFSQGENYIKNYCSPIGKEQEIFDKLTTIELEITGDIVIGTYSDSSTDNGFKEYYNNSNINFEITNVKEATINVSGLGLEVKNKYLYPEINLNNYTPNYSIEAASYSDSMNDYIQRNYQSNENYTIDTNVFYTNNTPKIRVIYKDFLKGIAAVTSTIKDVPYVFHNLSRDIVEEWPYTNEGGLEIRCPKISGLYSDIQYVQVSLQIGNNDFDNYFYIDGFQVEQDQQEKYFFNTSGSGHNNFQRWRQHSTLLNDNHNIFMYRDNENDYYNNQNYTFAPVIYTSSTEEETVTDSREYGNCKFFLYTKTYSNKENLLADDSIKNSDLTWGIFKLEDCTYIQTQEMKRRKIINDIINQFPQGSKICNKTKEDLEVYTILTATENPNTYYSYIKNVKLEKDLNVTGTLTLNDSPISIQQSFGQLTFKVKSQCDKTFHKEIATLNSNAKYFYLLDHLPTLNSYLDFDSGKYITDSTLGNNENVYNHVYVINNNQYKQVENVLVIRYKSNLDSLVPIFHRDEVTENKDKYKYVIAQLPRNVEENHNKTDYILNFELFNNSYVTNSFGKNFWPYPIYNLTVANS